MVFKIYTISCINQELCKEKYVGSTDDEYRRKKEHKNVCNNPNARDYNFKVYQTIRENGGWENWKFEIIEVCDDTINTKKLAREREEFWRKTLNATLNSQRAFLTEEEKKEYQAQYYQEHKEEKAVYGAQHYQDNREKIAARAAEKITCICGSVFRRDSKVKHEQSEKHKAFILLNVNDDLH
tara:strand:+ start:173 stop:718 length:546 start_codon:yes stop_codon:yes gene_type:complete